MRRRPGMYPYWKSALLHLAAYAYLLLMLWALSQCN